jgi:hypothetical protein
MSSTERSNQNPVAAFIGIDWADQKHAIVLQAAASTASLEHRSIGAEPDALVGIGSARAFCRRGQDPGLLGTESRSADPFFDGL